MTKNEKRIERLIELRRVLRNHARAEARGAASGAPQDSWGNLQVACKIGGKRVAWDMGSWRYDVPSPELEQFRCDTAACALGSAALDPWHIARGLHFPRYDNSPVYLGRAGDEAGAAFYHITLAESLWLFMPDEYPDPKNVRPTDVIARVNSLIKHYRDGRDDDLYQAFLERLDDFDDSGEVELPF